MARFCLAQILAVVVLLSMSLPIRAGLTTNLETYQFGQPIEASWSAAPDSGARIGVFLPGQCWDSSESCIADTNTYPYLQVAEISAASGTFSFNRAAHSLFVGSLEVRIWDSSTDMIIFNKTIQVVGTVSLTVPSPIYLTVPTSINSVVSSQYASESDWIGLFPADLCENPDDCFIAWTYISAPPTLQSWWNTTFHPDEWVNTSAVYKIAYVSGGSASAFWPGVYSEGDRYRAVSSPFQFQLSGTLQSAKSIYSVQQPVNFTFTAAAAHSDYDCVAVYDAGAPALDGGSDAWLFAWIPDGSSGLISLNGIPKPGQYVAHYMVTCRANLVSQTVSFTVENQVSISSKSVCLPGRKLAINYNTTGLQVDNDILNMYTDACVTIADIEAATGSSACRFLATVAFIPAGAKLGQVSMTCPGITDDGLVDGKFRLWYMSNWVYPLAQISSGSVQSVSVLGKCASGCSNANAFCTSNSQCTSCSGVAAPTCVPVPAPTFVGATKPEGWSAEVFPGGTEGVISFSIEALDNGNGPLSLEQTGFSAESLSSGEVSIVQSAITGGSKWVVTWNTQPLQQNYFVSFCFAVVDTFGAPSEDRCYFLQTRGRNCRSYGDPHMTTFDGIAYDFFGFGDFYLIKSNEFSTDKFSVQVRYSPCGGSNSVSCNNAIAFTDSMSSFAVYFKEDAAPQYAYKKGSRSELAADANITLPNGAQLQYDTSANTLYVILRSGIYVEVGYVHSATNNLQVKMPSSAWLGKVSGLCGSWDNNANYEFVYANGTSLDYGSSSDYDLYTWGTSWRVIQNDSAFDYTISGSGDGFFNYTYAGVNYEHPTGGVPSGGVNPDPAITSAANTLCNGILGLANEELSACIFDIQLTGSIEAGSVVAASFVQGCSQSATLTTQCRINENCPNRCNFRGLCNNAVCSCIAGFGGADCAARVSTPPPVKPGSSVPVAPPNSATNQVGSILISAIVAILTALFIRF